MFLKKYIFTSLISLSICFAKEINLSIAPFGESKPSTTLTFNWDEKLLTETSSFDYNHDIARIACALSSMSYLDFNSLSEEENILKDAYRLMGFENSCMKFFYDVNFSDPELKYDQCAFSIAHSDSVIIVTVRGVNLQNSYEWISCLNLSNKTKKAAMYHEGFYKPALEIEKKLTAYVKENNLDCSNMRILLTGHSRGGGVANLLAMQLLKDEIFSASHIFAYTFASPNTTLARTAQNPEYGFIWNIVNAEDTIAAAPFNFGKWKYSKFGNVLVLVNSWNTDSETYNSQYLTRVNSYFYKIKKRFYNTLGSANFIPVQIARKATGINQTVEAYYKSPLSLYRIGKFYLKHVNPDDLMTHDFSKGRSFTDKFALHLAVVTNGMLNVVAAIDSHTCETYLSHLLALNEQEAFSDAESKELILDGTEEGVVLDRDGNILLEFYNGLVKPSSIRLPVAAMDSGTDKIVIGLPSNEDFNILIAKNSLFPTTVNTQILTYDARGVYKNQIAARKIYPYKGTYYSIRVEKRLNSPANSDDSFSYNTLNNSGYRFSKPKFISLETNYDSRKRINFGLHIGVRNSFYSSFFMSTGIIHAKEDFDVQAGFGFGQTISGPFFIDAEALCRCHFNMSDPENFTYDDFNIMPSARISLSYAPVQFFKISVSGVLDFNTKEQGYSVLEPAFQLGIKI